VCITPHTLLALWVRFYDLFLSGKKTISLSAVALAGACLCGKCYRWPYTFQKTCFEFQNRGSVVGLILDPDSDMMFLTVKNLTVVCMKEQPVTSHLRFTTRINRWSILWRVSITTVKTKVLRVMTVLTHVSSSSSAWRKEMNATNTRIYHFTSDKTDDRQNILTS